MRFGIAIATLAATASIAAAVSAIPAGARDIDPVDVIVVLREDAGAPRPAAVAAEHASRFGADVRHVYEHALDGYAARVSERGLSAIAADRRVAYVERDGRVTTTATQSPAPWGLDRVDQRALPLSGSFTTSSTGAGVKVYIVDTGIRATHADLAGRVTAGRDVIDGALPAADCNGHGTHVAGTVGGSTYGVAKGVTLVPVRVLDCNGSGSWSGVIAGIDWVAGDVTSGVPAVANMSLGGGASTAVDSAVKRAVGKGISFVVAAGNGNSAGVAQDACKTSPARVPEAVTVGATDSADRKASWSNYGRCVDLFAPGVGISSAWSTGDSAAATISGTSMASPHAAGAAALHLEQNPAATPAAVSAALAADATKGIVLSSKTANNHLLFTRG